MMKQHLINLYRTVIDPLAWPVSKREIHSLLGLSSVPEVLNAAGMYRGLGHYKSLLTFQVEEEIVGLAEFVRSQKPKVIVEIGTFRGGTLFLWSRTNPQAHLFVSIDLPGGRYGGGYHPLRKRLFHEFVSDRPHSQMALIQANSHDPRTVEQLAGILAGRPIDFLFIDGDHTYTGIKQDFEMYAPLVTNGVVAFHDIVTQTQDCGVYQFWSEIKQRYPYQEWVAPNSSMGIGAVQKRP